MQLLQCAVFSTIGHLGVRLASAAHEQGRINLLACKIAIMIIAPDFGWTLVAQVATVFPKHKDVSTIAMTS